ncbi:agmatinase [candidate division KSB1 bacterium]|nr:agmatinase [candidate division KSB1 bacterium]
MNDKSFDPNDVGVANGRFFGFPYKTEESKLVLLPVPWDVTTSYGAGTAHAPLEMIKASTQLDFYDFDIKHAWKIGIGTHDFPHQIWQKNQLLRPVAREVIDHLESGGHKDDDQIQGALHKVNAESESLNSWVHDQAHYFLKQNIAVGIVGGDHSTPLGLLSALSERYAFGILHIDAHADLRPGYEGFIFSHASIMHHALKLPGVKRLVQVGIRDLSEQEMAIIKENPGIHLFDDYSIAHSLANGDTWHHICNQLIDALPDHVYISFDIDGLDPSLCPHTGTPVPGGLTYRQAIELLSMLYHANKKIIGFDLCEVNAVPDNEWDANVGARILYKLANITASRFPH